MKTFGKILGKKRNKFKRKKGEISAEGFKSFCGIFYFLGGKKIPISLY